MMSTMPFEVDVLEFREVVLVRFPFTNQVVFKQRPAVIVSNRVYNAARPDVVIMAITSQLRPAKDIGDVWIEDWLAANLLKPSAVKPVFATIEQGLILKSLGHLGESDRSALRSALHIILG